jgi:hypothetical protein
MIRMANKLYRLIFPQPVQYLPSSHSSTGAMNVRFVAASQHTLLQVDATAA